MASHDIRMGFIFYAAKNQEQSYHTKEFFLITKRVTSITQAGSALALQSIHFTLSLLQFNTSLTCSLKMLMLNVADIS